ncbi:MAG TPA: response regulator [Thermoanaerobaculia bacterium]|nr:response regulator [Thermoanaerobaculia bacterium]
MLNERLLEPQAPAEPALPPLRILLAEDSRLAEVYTVRLLERRGCSVVVARNGREAVAACHRQPFDLILMDVQMPEMNGIEATAAVRASEREHGRRTPILALTAGTTPEENESCRIAGMDGCLLKPVREQDLSAAFAGLAPVAADGGREESPSLDRAALMAEAGGDGELLERLVAIFREEAARLLAEIRQAAVRGDGTRLSDAAHALKGTAGHWSRGAVFRAAARLENRELGVDPEAAAADIKELQREIPRLLLALDHILS